MRTCTVQLTSTTPYSASRKLDEDIYPFLNKERHDDRDLRLWRDKATTDDNGEVCIPAMGLKMAVDEAIKRLNIKVGEKGRATYTKIFLAGQICDDAPGVRTGVHRDDMTSIDIFANSDGVRGSGKRVKRRFPYLPKWAGQAHFLILDDVIKESVFELAVVEAGRLIGVGRFRPERGGLLGRFKADNFRWSEI